MRDRDLGSVVGRVIEIASSVTNDDAERVDREGVWPESSMRALQAAGLAGLVVPIDDGGQGFGLFALARTCEILAERCASTALCFGMHCVASAVIAAKATAHHRERYLEPIVRGRHITTLALSEPGTGAHFYLPQTRLLARAPGELVLDGVKAFVTNGGHADSYVVSAVAADAGVSPGTFSCVVVPHDAPGLEWGAEWAGLGMRGNSSRGVSLRNVVVPEAQLLGAPGDQIWYVFSVVAPFFLIAMAGTYLGIASRALKETLEHVAKRRFEHSGGTLGEVAVVQHRLGTLFGLVERTRGLVHRAAHAADAGERDALPSLCAAKAEVADCVVGAVNEAMTLCGGAAYRTDGVLWRLLRDARAAHVMSPTTDLLRTWIGRALLDLPLLGD
ncbi:MAG TPA: acyl-CoA dehydrogenase family protein [Polyangiaceae bacterium]